MCRVRNVTILAILLIGFCPRPAEAIWMRTHSIEWWVNISDTVAVAEVASAKAIDPLNELWDSQQVTCIAKSTLKGGQKDSFNFRQDFRRRADADFDTPPLRAKDSVLIFFAEASDKRTSEVVFWVNLSKPDPKLASQAAYNNDCKLLGESVAVLTLVKNRIAKEDKTNVKKRGLIVQFAGYETRDMYWDLVRTADPEYRQTLIKELQSGGSESAIYNLISYPSKETADLIRPFLRDKTVDETSPIRRSAYLALKLLGESPEKRDGFDPDVYVTRPWLFAVGFEDTAYFPYGDWKRLEKKRSKR
jgi:hypothetical protein